MKKNAITLLGVGDILIDREKPETIFDIVKRSVIDKSDIFTIFVKPVSIMSIRKSSIID